jgi:hypothetical protein
VTGADGRQKIESRTARSGQADSAAFMAGAKRILMGPFTVYNKDNVEAAAK